MKKSIEKKEKGFSHAEGGGTTNFEVVLTRDLEVLAIVMGVAKCFYPLRRGVQKVLPCLEGGTQKGSDPRFSHFVAPPPRN